MVQYVMHLTLSEDDRCVKIHLVNTGENGGRRVGKTNSCAPFCGAVYMAAKSCGGTRCNGRVRSLP